MASGKKKTASFPTRQQIVDFINSSPTPVGKREIARAFNIKGPDRMALKALLRELKAEGAVETHQKRRVSRPGSLPSVAVLQISDLTIDGDMLAEPVAPEHRALRVRIEVVRDARTAPARGDRVLAKLERIEDGLYRARVMRRLDRTANRVMGVYETGADGGRIIPADKREKRDYVVPAEEAGGAKPGDLVMGETLPGRPLGLPRARIVESFGSAGAAGAISRISIESRGIPVAFHDAALKQAEAAKPVALGSRADLRTIPLVTIDGADARDFDDAVFAEPVAGDADLPDGWHLIVAIADVAHYVRPDDPLDREARERGNSVYFPDRVVPMLPEKLSNDLCSLRPNEDRACFAAHLWISHDGRLKKHRFERALMRSAARLTYEQVQAARDGAPDDLTAPLVDSVIAPLYGAYAALATYRENRHALEIEMAERQVRLGEDGKIAEIVPRARLDSHKLIEEFMITANVAAAETLEARRQPCMYRVHEPPDLAKVESLRTFLKDLEFSMPAGAAPTPQAFNRLLDQARGTPYERMINELTLRSQSQAYYGPKNLGHFGLALKRYAHFTSPIRRYADLLVHRALIGARGPDGIGPDAAGDFDDIGEHISSTERRAMAAERDALERYIAVYMQDNVGADFAATVNGVTRFGLFVTLLESGADGLIPISSLPIDYYIHDEQRHSLIGERSGLGWRLGDSVAVRLLEANALTGGLIFEMLDKPRKIPGAKTRSGGRKSVQRKQTTKGKHGKKPRSGGRSSSRKK